MGEIYAYLIIFKIDKQEDGWFSVRCPGLGGVYAQGETEEEAMGIATSMTEGILNISCDYGDEIPENEFVIALKRPASTILATIPEGSVVFPAPWVIAAQNENCESRL